MSVAKKTTDPSNVYDVIASTISSITGVQLGEKQKNLVESRLNRRFRELKIQENEYLSYFHSNREQELSALISLLTTHHTFFFREYGHFEYLLESLPDVVMRAKSEGRNKIRIWSAASSYGHEAYSLGMFLNYHLPKIDPSMKFEILGSDVCEDSVKRANKGIYRWDELKKAPQIYMTKNWMKGTGDIAHFVKASPVLKEKVSFKVNNLTNFSSELVGQKFDYIFCRNVFIYFSNQQITEIVNKMKHHLHEGATLILGLSESLMEIPDGFKNLGRSIYQKGVSLPKSKPVQNDSPQITNNIASASQQILKVLCIDDSPVVIKLLSKILTKEKGFEIVGTAENGLIAQEFIKNHPEVDVVTLDIHMPEMNGVDYLAHTYNDNHPPVVMVSSVSQEDSDLALKALELGATDYLEKPTIENFDLVQEELQRKLKSAYMAKRMVENTTPTQVTKAFSHQFIVTNTDEKAKFFFGGFPNKKELHYILREIKAPQPPVFFVMENIEKFGDKILPEFQGHCDLRVDKWQGDRLRSNRVYLIEPKDLGELDESLKERKTVSLFLCDVSEKVKAWTFSLRNNQIIVEDDNWGRSPVYRDLVRRSVFQSPYTSFSYESDKYLVDEE